MRGSARVHDRRSHREGGPHPPGSPARPGPCGIRRPLLADAKATASGSAEALTRADFAFDDNYATRWAPARDAKGAWLQLDLGGETRIRRQLIRPEYAWKPYRFALEASTDGSTRQTVEDFTRQAATGSPILSEKPVGARYLRLVFPEDVKGADIGVIEWSVF